MTYSIAARCSLTGAFGIAITSSSICAASRCAWISPFGAVITQNVTDPNLGPAGLAALRQAHDAPGILAGLTAMTAEAEWRQIAIVDGAGKTALHMGTRSMPIAASAAGDGCIALGNLLSHVTVPDAMIAAFIAAAGQPLAERLMQALEAGRQAGGEGGGERSAGLHIAESHDWPTVDLRIDWSGDPIAELRHIWTIYEPQKPDFIARALAPSSAPPF